jgi:hypothetical protein
MPAASSKVDFFMAGSLSTSHLAFLANYVARDHGDIAAFFRENGGRVAQIAKDVRFAKAAPAPKHLLPTPGALGSGHPIYEARQALIRCDDPHLSSGQGPLQGQRYPLRPDRRGTIAAVAFMEPGLS